MTALMRNDCLQAEILRIAVPLECFSVHHQQVRVSIWTEAELSPSRLAVQVCPSENSKPLSQPRGSPAAPSFHSGLYFFR